VVVAGEDLLGRLAEYLRRYGVVCGPLTTSGEPLTCFYGNLRVVLGEPTGGLQADVLVRLAHLGGEVLSAEVLVPAHPEFSRSAAPGDVRKLAEEVLRVLDELVRLNPVEDYVARVGRAVRAFTSRAREVDHGGVAMRRVYELLSGSRGSEAPDPDLVWGRVALSILLSSVLYERFCRSAGLPPLAEVLKRGEVVQGLGEALERLSSFGYGPQVGVVGRVLRYLPPQLSTEVSGLLQLALELAAGGDLAPADLPGRVFQEVMGDLATRKGYATYYTELPAAYLLTYLATRTALGLGSHRGSRDLLERVSRLRVSDFACGTGTLLAATYYNLLRALEEAYPSGVAGLGELLRELVEGSLYCFEAMGYAAHVASLNLALLSPRPVGRVNVLHLPLGYVGGVPRLGSLELVDRPEVLGPLAAEVGEGFDLVVMNPPFTRATGRVGRRFTGRSRRFLGFVESEEIRRALVTRLAKLREGVSGELARVVRDLLTAEAARYTDLGRLLGERGLGYYSSVGQAGLGLLFLYLAYRYVRPGGTIAFVLPRNLLAGISWFPARALLASKFHVRYVIVSSDPVGGYNFSEGASLSEVLLVATRVDRHEDSEETVFVNLLRKPRTPGEALALAGRLLHGVEVPGAVVRVVKRGELLRLVENWNTFVAVADGYLVDYYLRFLETGEVAVGGEAIRVPLTRFTYLIDRLGVSSPQFHSCFEVVEGPTEYPVLYSGTEGVRLRILVEPNAYAVPRAPCAGELYSRYSSRLLLPDRVWWDTAHAVVLYSTRPTVSNVFYSARLRGGEAFEKATALYLNTTWGLLTVLFSREETRGRWTRLKVGHWRLLRVLDVGRLGSEVVARLVELFDRVSAKPLRRVVEQYDPKDPDPTRLEVDLGFLRALEPGLDPGRAEGGLLELYRRVHRALSLWLGGRARGREL
jgi:hypothetical protein